MYAGSSDDDGDDDDSASCSFDFQPIFLNSVAEIVGIAIVTLVINRYVWFYY